jgi:Skp family chaperone for outer membrane proteins
VNRLFENIGSACLLNEVHEIGITFVSVLCKDETGTVYSVLDGQQRFVTISLMYAALRDRMQQIIDEAEKSGGRDQDDLSKMQEEVDELQKCLKPTKSKKNTVYRVTTRKGNILQDILNSNSHKQANLTSSYMMANYTKPERAVVQNLQTFADYLQEYNWGNCSNLASFVEQKVKVVVSIAKSAAAARSHIAGLGKGKDASPVDSVRSQTSLFVNVQTHT